MSVACVSLRDPYSAAVARIAVGLGFNCFEFTIERRGQPVAVLWSAPDFESGRAWALGSGIPLLFPFAGRMPGTTFTWEGRDFQLVAADGQGNAIHGFVYDRPWRVVEQTPQRVAGEFQASRDDAGLRSAWPADFRIRVAYELEHETLRCQIQVDNPDQRPLPYGLGTHPYFRLPLGGRAADPCVVRVPVTQQWELRELRATGARIPLPPGFDLAAGMAFRDLRLDQAYSGLTPGPDGVRCSLRDPESGLTVVQRFDPIFRECVIYTPERRQAICVEPWTCAPGCFELMARGIDTGVRILAPGESVEARVDILVEPAG